MQVQQPKYQGLVADLLPNVRIMQTIGHFIFRYVTGPILIRKLYASAHMILFLLQYFFILTNLIQNMSEVSELTCECKKKSNYGLLSVITYKSRS